MFGNQSRSFIHAKSGSVAIFFGLSFFALLLTAGIAIDFSIASHVRTRAQAALDAAVLAAAVDASAAQATVNGEESVAGYGKVFNANFAAVSNRFKVQVAGLRVVPGALNTVVGEAQLRIGRRIFASMYPDLKVEVKSQAKFGGGARICILALNPTMDKAIDLSGTADILAPDCAVYSNSSSSTSISLSGSSAIDAGAICAVGDTSGSGYTPEPKSDCQTVPDPFPGVIEQLVDSAPECSNDGWSFSSGNFSDSTVPPGTNICGTWSLSAGAVINLAPGIYYAKRLSLGSGADIIGQGVTIILYGSESYFNLQAQAGLNIKAPNTGPTAGIVLAQDPRSSSESTNTIIGGGYLEPTGMIYLPSRELRITGDGSLAATVSQFAIVADHIVMEGNGLLSVRGGADFNGADLPALPAVTGGNIALAK